MAASINQDAAELAKFSALAHRWWDPESEFRPLHQINPLRLAWIESLAGLRGKDVLDVGCGGGILAESMAAAGARVTGIDLSEKALGVAKLHRLESGLTVDYRLIAAEAFAVRGFERRGDAIVQLVQVLLDRFGGISHARLLGSQDFFAVFFFATFFLAAGFFTAFFLAAGFFFAVAIVVLLSIVERSFYSRGRRRAPRGVPTTKRSGISIERKPGGSFLPRRKARAIRFDSLVQRMIGEEPRCRTMSSATI